MKCHSALHPNAYHSALTMEGKGVCSSTNIQLFDCEDKVTSCSAFRPYKQSLK